MMRRKLPIQKRSRGFALLVAISLLVLLALIAGGLLTLSRGVLSDVRKATSSLANLVNPASKFGRSFRMISFRWLSPNEI